MQLSCLSVNHHNTPVELRECLNLPPEAIEEAFEAYPVRTGPFEPIAEMVVLSTCNRLEVYALISTPENGSPDPTGSLLTYLAQVFRLPTGQVAPYILRYDGLTAADHLFRVAAGLDSIAVGETQVLGQVARALELSLRLGSARHALSSLFRAAISAGKRVHTETAIGRRPVSISTVGIELAESQYGSLAGASILVVGAGKVGAETLNALRARGAGAITLANRTPGAAREMAVRYGARDIPYGRLADGLAGADLVFSSTAAPSPILDRALLAEVMARRPGRSLVLVDLGVPRNVASDAREVPGVQLFDMDDIQAFTRQTGTTASPEVPLAERIVAEEVAAYGKLLRVIPYIGELHKKVEQIRQHEVQKALRQLGNPTGEIAEQIDVFSRSLVRKILHEPTMHLRNESDQETLDEDVDALARLFDLGEYNPEQALLA